MIIDRRSFLTLLLAPLLIKIEPDQLNKGLACLYSIIHRQTNQAYIFFSKTYTGLSYEGHLLRRDQYTPGGNAEHWAHIRIGYDLNRTARSRTNE